MAPTTLVLSLALLTLLLVSGWVSAAPATSGAYALPHGRSVAPSPGGGFPVPAAGPRAWLNSTGPVGPSPPMLLWDSLAWDPIDGYFVLFGGCSETVCPMPAQTWTFFNGSWHNITALGAQPPARSYAMMAFDGTDGYLVLFGGVGTSVLNDTWTFLGGHWTNRSATAAPGPTARWAGSLSYDRTDGELVLFGGMDPLGALLDDTWSYTGGAWTDLTLSAQGPPPPRYETAMAWDDADQVVVLTDGYGSSGQLLNDTWTFQNGRWQNATGGSGPLPPARTLASLSYAGSAGFLLEFGGYGAAGALNDTWTYQNNRWSDLGLSLATAPPVRGSAAVAEDTIGWTPTGRVTVPFVLLYGGDFVPCPSCGVQGRNDTWVFESPPQASAAASPTTAEIGQPVAFTGSASGGTPPYTYSWKFPDGTTAAGPSAHYAFPTPGPGAVRLTAADAAGAPAVTTVTVTIVGGPSVAVTATPAITDVGLPVQFAAVGSGGQPPYTISWDFGDGAVANSSAASHLFTTSATFPATASITDEAGGSATAGVSVVVHTRPTATIFVATSTPSVAAPVELNASILGGTAPYRVVWSFGDGGTDTSSNTNWTYVSPGRYLVTLNVTDAVNVSVQDAAIVAVAAAEPPASPGNAAPMPWIEIGGVALLIALAAAVGVVLLRRSRRPPPPVAPARAVTPSAPPAWDEGPEEDLSQR